MAILFWLYILSLSLVSTFPHIDCVEVSYGLLPTRFSSVFLANSYAIKKGDNNYSKLSFRKNNFNCIIRTLINNYTYYYDNITMFTLILQQGMVSAQFWGKILHLCEIFVCCEFEFGVFLLFCDVI